MAKKAEPVNGKAMHLMKAKKAKSVADLLSGIVQYGKIHAANVLVWPVDRACAWVGGPFSRLAMFSRRLPRLLDTNRPAKEAPLDLSSNLSQLPVISWLPGCSM